MKFFSLYLLTGLFCLFGCTEKDPHNPNNYFTRADQLKMISEAVRYSAKLPPGANHETKFDTAFNWYYKAAAAECDFRACAPANNGSYYFLMTRKARSIWPAREAIGGRLKLDKDLNLQEYEEVFRTWKMAEDSLNQRAFELFDLMISNKDLTPYYSRHMGDRYIEFPDDRFYFDKAERKWRDRAMDATQLEH